MSRYTLSASGNSSASPEGFVAEELSPIRSPDAPVMREICGLAEKFQHLMAARAANEHFSPIIRQHDTHGPIHQ
jgi:hypothetical protein